MTADDQTIILIARQRFRFIEKLLLLILIASHETCTANFHPIPGSKNGLFRFENKQETGKQKVNFLIGKTRVKITKLRVDLNSRSTEKYSGRAEF